MAETWDVDIQCHLLKDLDGGSISKRATPTVNIVGSRELSWKRGEFRLLQYAWQECASRLESPHPYHNIPSLLIFLAQ
jgi:hypothetical protein